MIKERKCLLLLDKRMAVEMASLHILIQGRIQEFLKGGVVYYCNNL